MKMLVRRSLATSIVEVLAKAPLLSAQELSSAVNNRGKEYTLRAVFKELRLLQDEGVIIRSGAAYSIRLPWIHEQRAFFEALFDHYSRRALFSTLFAEPEEKQLWRFSDIRQMDDFWIQLAFALFEYTGKRRLFYWLRHSWFQLLHPNKEAQWQTAIAARNRHVLMIVEEDTFLSRHNSRTWLKGTFDSSFAPSPFESQTCDTLAVIGEYIVTVRLEARTRNEIDALYRGTRSARELAALNPSAIFDRKIQSSVRLERAPKRAAKMLRQFERYFGVRAE